MTGAAITAQPSQQRDHMPAKVRDLTARFSRLCSGSYSICEPLIDWPDRNRLCCHRELPQRAMQPQNQPSDREHQRPAES